MFNATFLIFATNPTAAEMLELTSSIKVPREVIGTFLSRPRRRSSTGYNPQFRQSRDQDTCSTTQISANRGCSTTETTSPATSQQFDPLHQIPRGASGNSPVYPGSFHRSDLQRHLLDLRHESYSSRNVRPYILPQRQATSSQGQSLSGSFRSEPTEPTIGHNELAPREAMLVRKASFSTSPLTGRSSTPPHPHPTCNTSTTKGIPQQSSQKKQQRLFKCTCLLLVIS
jgi:hypothetical protein